MWQLDTLPQQLLLPLLLLLKFREGALELLELLLLLLLLLLKFRDNALELLGPLLVVHDAADPEHRV